MAFKRRSKILADFSMAGMNDIVFLLLIFFMLSSTLVSPNVLKLFLPSSDSKTISKQTVSVSITQNREYFVNKEPVSLESMASKLQDLLKDEKEPVVVLNAESGVPIQYVVNVMDIANKLKYKLVLATKPPSEVKYE